MEWLFGKKKTQDEILRDNRSDDLDKAVREIERDINQLAPILTKVFLKEADSHDCVKTLFRGTSLASRLMSHCFKTFGSKYLKQILEPHIKQLLDQEAPYFVGDKCPTPNKPQSTTCGENFASCRLSISYEIDSTKLEQSDDISVNQKNLLKLTKEILDSILASANDFPSQLRTMCQCLREVLYQRYPQDSCNLSAVGTVMFLRFINPAIVSPYEAGIVDRQPSPKTLRGLMLVSKILQNIANNVEFSKEQHMIPFNSFVKEHFEPLKKWVASISAA